MSQTNSSPAGWEEEKGKGRGVLNKIIKHSHNSELKWNSDVYSRYKSGNLAADTELF